MSMLSSVSDAGVQSNIVDSSSDEKDRSRVSVLPPCRICGDNASGLHYGVNSCEACKGFFRRSMFNKDKYICSKEKHCEIIPGKRSHCAFCRYQKCLEFGMSVEAIRTGRYTHEKKAADTIEVKTLQSSKLLSASEESIQLVMKQLTASVENTEIVDLLSTHYSQLSGPFDTTKRLLLENQRIKEEFFGLAYLSHEQHQSFFRSTGIDLDNRAEAIANWAYGSSRRLFLVITIAKALPGFSDLPLKDQIALIKASRAEAITVLTYNRWDSENMLLYTTHVDQISLMCELVQIYDDPELVKIMFSATFKFQKLGLTVIEMLLVLGVIITFPDRVELQAKDKVESLQQLLVNSLQFCLRTNHPNEKNLVARVLNSLVPLREVTARANKALPKIHKDWVPVCQIDPFWTEFIEDSSQWNTEHI